MEKNDWRGRAKRAIKAYPALLRKERELHSCRTTITYTWAPGGNEKGRATEDAALRELRPDEQRMLDSVRNAIATTERYRNGKDRIKVMELVYWKKTHDLHGAALKCNYSYSSVQEWNADFIGLVDAYYRILGK